MGRKRTFGDGQKSGNLREEVMIFIVPRQQNFAMGSLAQISSGAIWCSFTRFRTRFRRVLVQVPREVPEGSGEDRYLVRFRKFPVQLPDEVPEGVGEDA